MVEPLAALGDELRRPAVGAHPFFRGQDLPPLLPRAARGMLYARHFPGLVPARRLPRGAGGRRLKWNRIRAPTFGKYVREDTRVRSSPNELGSDQGQLEDGAR